MAAYWTGYGVAVRYSWPFIIFLIVVVVGLKRGPSFRIYLARVAVVSLLVIAGMFSGDWIRRIGRYRICKSCEPLLEAMERFREHNGQYPQELEVMPDYFAVQDNAGIRVRQGKFTKHGISLDDMETVDAMVYLHTDHYVCIVPVTKRLPMSFTRLYVYVWSSEKPEWTYDHLIWDWNASEKAGSCAGAFRSAGPESRVD